MSTRSGAEAEAYLEHLRYVLDYNGMVVDEVVLPDEREIALRGLRLHYHDWGNPDLPPVVFLHGAGLTAHTWDAVCVALRSRYHCIALDLRGHGDSAWAEIYGVDEHVRDARALVEALELRRPCLVGMSMGGMVAARYAIGYRDLGALVLVDVPTRLHRASGGRVQRFIDSAELDSVEDFVERSMRFNPRRKPEMLRRSLLHNLRQTESGRWTWKYDPRHYNQHNRPNAFSDVLRETWGRIDLFDLPVLVVRGGQSEVVSADDAASFAASLPNGRCVEVPGAGHTVQGDNPASLSAALEAFLAEVSD